MKYNYSVSSFFFSFIVLFFIGCGGGSEAEQTTIIPLKKGYIYDSPIAGLDYECGDIAGVTTESGMFECRTFPVVFKVGKLEIGTINSIPSDKKVYPQDLLNKKRTNFTDSKVIELTRFLQSLDDNGDIKTNIKITPSIKKRFTKEQTLSSLSQTKQKELIENIGKTYVTEEEAISHLKERLEKLVSIGLTPAETTLRVGDTKTLTITGSYSNDITKAITTQATFTTSSQNIATVNSRGLVTAKGVGTATITAKVGALTKTTTITVTEANLVSLKITPTTLADIAKGETAQLTATGTYSDNATKDITSSITWSSSDTSKAIVNSSGSLTTYNVPQKSNQ